MPASRAYMIGLVLPVYAYLTFSGGSGTVTFATTVVATLAYVASVFAYFAVSRMAFAGQTAPIWVSAALACLIGVVYVGSAQLWMVFTGVSMVVLGGYVVGRLSAAGQSQGKVFVIATIVVGAIAAAQYSVLWSDLMKYAGMVSEEALENIRPTMKSLGYAEKDIGPGIEQSRAFMNAVIRVLPSFTVLATVAQFTVGYLWFAIWASRKWPQYGINAGYVNWRVPFGFTPVVIVAIVARLLGGDTVRLVADNVLVALSVYYAVCGLSLIEFYLKRLKISVFVKILFYVMLFFTQLVGFVAAAILGFVDSFTNWRHRATVAEAQ